ncbi:hypothetical protein BT69DRAFT_1325016 [Atractiella rhizophila]|nr:hypothetical protein BT69DRAFT_1325016 [Atractiella rhizophila]
MPRGARQVYQYIAAVAYELRDFPYADVNNNLHIRDEPPLQRATAQRPRVQGGQANRPYLTRLSSRLGTRRSLRHNPYDIFSNALAEHDSFFLEDDFVSDPEHLGMHTSSTVANSGPKRTTRKYKVSSSHPRPVLPGFSKDIPSPEEAASKRKKRVRKRPRGLDVDDHSDVKFPVLYLEEADSKLKSFTLKCGHVVCGVCMAAARRRCEDAKRNTGWVPYGGGRGKSGKGKGREIDDPDGVDENWTVCPARGCLGGTDLLANAKEPEMAPWELFV